MKWLNIVQMTLKVHMRWKGSLRFFLDGLLPSRGLAELGAELGLVGSSWVSITKGPGRPLEFETAE
jgi:hypothetical protein